MDTMPIDVKLRTYEEICDLWLKWFCSYDEYLDNRIWPVFLRGLYEGGNITENNYKSWKRPAYCTPIRKERLSNGS